MAAASASGGGLAGWAERSALRRAGHLTAAGPVPGSVPGTRPNFCCTPAGRLGPYNTLTAPAGGACFGLLPSGARVTGQACY